MAISANFFESGNEMELRHMYLRDDLLQNLIDNCTAAHFFEDNPPFDCELNFLSPSTLRATEK